MLSVVLRKIRTVVAIYSANGWKGVARRIRKRFTRDTGYLDNMPREFLQADAEGRFSYLVETGHWDANGESVSGHGSTVQKTQQYRSELSDLIRDRSLRSVFDAPCGDYNWMCLVVAETSIAYIGGDIVRPLIERNIKMHQGLTFIHFDITKDAFPTSDIWHCRDCLFHLSFLDIAKALSNFRTSQIPYALLTSDTGSFRNKDIETGDFRYIDLLRRPFYFPEPELWLSEPVEPNRRVGLWPRVGLDDCIAKFATAVELTAAT
jgi:hypothetical protein